MNWQPFNYEDYECGLFWVLAVSPEYDVDVADDGATVGTPTGETVRQAVLVWVEEDHDGFPCFDPVDSANLGSVSDDSCVTHFAEVVAPELPALKVAAA